MVLQLGLIDRDPLLLNCMLGKIRGDVQNHNSNNVFGWEILRVTHFSGNFKCFGLKYVVWNLDGEFKNKIVILVILEYQIPPKK